MRETKLIAEELRLLFEGPSWLGPPINGLLADVSEENASNKPLVGVHTIWELVLHIRTWLRIARLRLTASLPVDPTADENWPAPSGSWQDSVTGLRSDVAALREAVINFPPGRLEGSAPATEPQTFYVLLHGVIQHCAYHAGQIAVLKKVITEAQQANP